ncbi:MAG: gas vesicle protein GvpG [Crocinitomicaceae bacterium]|nr:gas vesicle protein GvpG [Crocinitomicaceae bacterium]
MQSIAFCQDCDRVLVSGKVIDSIRPQSFYNLMIVNRTTGQGVFGQPNGHFSVYANDNDSISLSVRGYDVVNLVVQADSNCQFKNTIEIIGKVQEIKEVVIRPLKTLEQIKEERENLALRETRTVTGIEVLQSPITALYQTFSKKEKAKRWIAEQEYKDDQERLLKELLRTYVAYDIFELSDEEFEEFIHFLNIDDNFLKTASEMELITFIKDKFDHYKSFKKGGKSTYFDVHH